MNIKKTIYLALVIIMIMTLAISCNNTPGSGVQDTQDQPVIASREPGTDTPEAKPQETILSSSSDDEFIYEEVDGGLAVTDYKGEAEEIAIPASCNGKSVIEIAEGAFMYDKFVKATIPDSVKIIKKHAFADCKNLTTVIMGNGVEEIGENAFTLNPKLMEVQLSNSLKIIGEFAFSCTSSLETIEITASVTEIQKAAFLESGLKTLTIPGSVKLIQEGAFLNCASLHTVTIQEGVETLGEGIFDTCTSLKEVYIPTSVKEIGIEMFFRTDKNAVIITPAGSYAETYAKENGITYRNQ